MAGTNQAREFLDLIIGGPVEFQATQPIQVAQFANGTEFDYLPGCQGDPCEILLLPTGHCLKPNIVVTPPNVDTEFPCPINFLNIIAAQSAIGTTSLDGSRIAATNFVAIGNSGYSGAQLTAANGTHIVASSEPVAVQVYGFDEADAYAYFSGVVK